MRKPALALLCTACLMTLSACSITGNQESDSSTSAGNASKPVENNISAGKPVEKAAKAEPKNMEEQVQDWLAEGLIKPTDDPNIWQATKPLPRPQFSLKHEKPIYPEAGYVYNEAGAEAVAKYWEELVPYILNTGDLEPLRHSCDLSFEYCKGINDVINDNLKTGSWNADYEAINIKFTGIGVPQNSKYPGEISVRQNLRISQYYYFDGETKILTRKISRGYTSYSNLNFIEDHWDIVISNFEDEH